MKFLILIPFMLCLGGCDNIAHPQKLAIENRLELVRRCSFTDDVYQDSLTKRYYLYDSTYKEYEDYGLTAIAPGVEPKNICN